MIDEPGHALAYRHMIYDVAIIGAGIAGASLAAQLDRSVSAVILEAEDQPGYHSTGRSAAFYTETYGGPDVQPLTTASKAWYFTQTSTAAKVLMVKKRGALHVDWGKDSGASKRLYDSLKPLSPDLQTLSASECLDRCSILQPSDLAGGIYDPDCCDIDVATVHEHFLRQAKDNGTIRRTNFRVAALQREQGHWNIQSAAGSTLRAKTIVNAAGAWADEIARLAGTAPLGLSPKRRTVAVFELKGALADADWPLVLDMAETFYFKPEGQYVLVSPADETPSAPCDAQPTVEDVAVAAHRFEAATGLALGRCHAKWAGLRTFAPDRSPVYGFDDQAPNFFWCAGQGGFGIQTAPAAGHLAASLLQGDTIPSHISACGIGADRYAPQRFLAAA